MKAFFWLCVGISVFFFLKKAIFANMTKTEKIVFVSLALPISALLPFPNFYFIYFIYSHFHLYGFWFPGFGHMMIAFLMVPANILLAWKLLKEYEKKNGYFAGKLIKIFFLSIVIQCVISVLAEPPHKVGTYL